MALDQLLAGLRASDGIKIFSQVSVWYLITSTLVIGVLTLIIDYAYMLWMRSRLVSNEASVNEMRIH